MQITPRDVELVRALYRHRFLRSRELQALVGGSPAGVLRRLQLLFHHGYLDRPRAQLDWYGQGSEPFVYALGKKGAGLLEEREGLARGAIRWGEKNRRAGRAFLQHALLVAEIMVSLELAVRRHGQEVRLLAAGEILTTAETAPRPRVHPFAWRAPILRYGARVMLGVIPDHAFGLEYQGRRTYFFLEADRGTMPVRRKGISGTSFARKLLAYHETWKQDLHRRLFGLPNFRLLTVTSSAERMGHLAEACRQVAAGSRLFLFTHADALHGQDFLTHSWKNAKGEAVGLLDPPTSP